MIEVKSTLPAAAVEASLRRAVERHHSRLIAVNHLGASLISTWIISQPALEQELLNSEPSFAVFLPFHIAVRPVEGGCLLQAASPCEQASLLPREDLEKLTRQAERWLRDVMQEASQPTVAHAAATASTASMHYSLGAREDQVNLRATVPPRIDSHGTKIEDLAGTGQQDTQGG